MARYRVEVAGHVASRFTETFDVVLVEMRRGHTILTVDLQDQAALHGLMEMLTITFFFLCRASARIFTPLHEDQAAQPTITLTSISSGCGPAQAHGRGCRSSGEVIAGGDASVAPVRPPQSLSTASRRLAADSPLFFFFWWPAGAGPWRGRRAGVRAARAEARPRRGAGKGRRRLAGPAGRRARPSIAVHGGGELGRPMPRRTWPRAPPPAQDRCARGRVPSGCERPATPPASGDRSGKVPAPPRSRATSGAPFPLTMSSWPPHHLGGHCRGPSHPGPGH